MDDRGVLVVVVVEDVDVWRRPHRVVVEVGEHLLVAFQVCVEEEHDCDRFVG